MIKGSAGNGLPLDHERSFKRALIGFAQIHDGILCHIFIGMLLSPKRLITYTAPYLGFAGKNE